uniref:Secreted protein n=1 Tax=Colobus angolensis palliatus TaxID=336983 RepID=A0A2K5II15_COLAP
MWGCTGAVAASEGLFFSASLCLTLLLSAWDGVSALELDTCAFGSVTTALFGGVSSSPQPELLNS